MLTNGSLQGVTILKDKILEDNTGVASHPDKNKSCKSLYFRYRLFYFIWFSETAGRRHGSADLIFLGTVRLMIRRAMDFWYPAFPKVGCLFDGRL